MTTREQIVENANAVARASRAKTNGYQVRSLNGFPYAEYVKELMFRNLFWTIRSSAAPKHECAPGYGCKCMVVDMVDDTYSHDASRCVCTNA